MTELTLSGFDRTRLLDRIAAFQAEARAIFGEDIDLSSDTMDGQHIGLYAEAVADLDELAELVWLSFDPDLASGQSLSRLVKFNGIERSQGAYSVVTLTATGAAGTLIPEGSGVSNQNGTIIVYTLADARISSSGTVDIEAATKEMGALYAGVSTLTVIDNPLFGWESVTNNAPVSVGKDIETDRQLRIRRRASVSKGNRNMLSALKAALLNLKGVIDVAALENVTPVTDKRGLPPHSIHAVVLGGNSLEIAQTIWVGKTGGSPTVGQQAVIIKDELQGDQVVRFSRPTNVDIAIRVYITIKSGWTYNSVNEIKRALFNYFLIEQQTGSPVTNSALYTPLNALGGFEINKIELSKGGAFAEQSIALKFFERAVVDMDDIEVIQS